MNRLTLLTSAWLALVLGTARTSWTAEPDMSARIDARLAEGWRDVRVQPAPRTTDAEFLRRVWLDLTGIIPPVNEHDGDGRYGARGFLADDRPDKRARLIDYLLTKPNHATHFANIWKNMMLPADANVLRFGGDRGLQTWLRLQFEENVPYDKLVRQVVLASGNANQASPALFYTALQLKPEELAASTSRVFCGVQISCAQCHDHPFDHWTRRDFWGFAAFFARLQRSQRAPQVTFQVADAPDGEVMIPDTDQIVPPQFLGRVASPDDDRSRRERLAEWLTSTDNPYFARASVNRVWALLFGSGLIDPVDDLGDHNPATHPELLDELAAWFAESGFDLKNLIRTLANTAAYQRSSQSAASELDRPELFARMAIKTLSAEQLYDCLAEAMRRRDRVNQAGFGRPFDQNRQTFLAKFRAPARGATEFQGGIPQALTLMNGALIQEATDLENSDLLLSLEAPFFTDESRVEVLFLSTVSRLPTAAEQKRLVAYVRTGGASASRREALSDILWSLLNSSEFILNH